MSSSRDSLKSSIGAGMGVGLGVATGSEGVDTDTGGAQGEFAELSLQLGSMSSFMSDATLTADDCNEAISLAALSAANSVLRSPAGSHSFATPLHAVGEEGDDSDS